MLQIHVKKQIKPLTFYRGTSGDAKNRLKSRHITSLSNPSSNMHQQYGTQLIVSVSLNSSNKYKGRLLVLFAVIGRGDQAHRK